MFNPAFLAYIFAKRTRSLLVAIVGGLLIGGFIIWPAYYYSSGMAARREAQKRHELPEKLKSINKYGYSCPYLAVVNDGEKYYFIGQAPSIGDIPQQFFCTQQQAQDAGYKLRQ